MMHDGFTIRIAGKSSTKQRQRFDPRTKRAYTPPSNIVNENDVRAIWREAGEPRLGDEEAIGVGIEIHVVRPKSHFKKDGSLSSEGKRHPIPRNKKPDLDNAVKTIFDALNTRAYRDDVQIAFLSASRRWAEVPETVVTIWPLES